MIIMEVIPSPADSERRGQRLGSLIGSPGLGRAQSPENRRVGSQAADNSDCQCPADGPGPAPGRETHMPRAQRFVLIETSGPGAIPVGRRVCRT
jgi:hypothetical protein